jgi:MFS family permease
MIRSVVNIASSAVYLMFPTFAGFVVGKAVDEAGKAAFHPAWGSLMAEISGHDPARRGRVMGKLGAAEDAGSVAGPILAGLLWSAWGVGALLAVRIGLAVVAEVYAGLVLPLGTRRRQPELSRTSPAALPRDGRPRRWRPLLPKI